jgi:hypothetical protein
MKMKPIFIARVKGIGQDKTVFHNVRAFATMSAANSFYENFRTANGYPDTMPLEFAVDQIPLYDRPFNDKLTNW